jgi:hypothetical protein
MNLDDVRKKTPSEINDAERKFLVEHKGELSASEIAGFALEDKPVDKKPEVKPEVKADDEGKVTIDATELSTLKAQIAALEIKANEGRDAKQQLDANEVHAFVQTHVKRGAIKAGEAEATEKMILASEGDQRDNFKKLIENLPDRVVAAGEQGLKDKPAVDTAADALEIKTKELMASDEGKGLSYADATKRVIAANEDLKNEYLEELAESQKGGK